MTVADGAPLPGIAPGEVGPAVASLGLGRRLVLVGLDRRGLADLLGAPARSVLMLATPDEAGAAPILRRLLDDLADLALDRWPRWPEPDPAARPWSRAAARLAAGGARPRLRRADPGIEFAGLVRIVDPAGVLLAVEVDPASPRRARHTVEVIEWCQARGAPAVALLPHRPPPDPPYDRLLYGARAFRAAAEPAAERLLGPRGGPHPASDTERRVKAALDADHELAPLFLCNQTVALAGATAPRVDLLWRAGRVVVELDGPDHHAPIKYADDRHRDHELMLAGYRVLRITNRQVATDLARAVEKVRAVVRLSRSEGRA